MTITIMLVIMTIALIAVAIFAGSARRILINRLRIAGYDIGTWWNNHAVGQGIWNAISPAIWIIAILIGLMFLAWIPLFVIVVAICTSMGSFWSGIFLGLLVLVCSFLFILKKIPGFRLVGTISFYLALILLIVFSWNFIFGWWSPGIQESWERLKENQKQELGDWMNETSTKTEGKSGKIGRIDIDKVVGYSEDGMQTYPIAKGKFVRLVSEYKGKKVSKASEGLVWVMFENDFGDFIKGSICLVPSRKVTWDWQSKVSPESTKPSTTSAVPGEKWRICWGNSLPKCEVGSLILSEKTVLITQEFSDPVVSLGKVNWIGKMIKDAKVEGTWQQEPPLKLKGKFFFKFSSDRSSAVGWTIDDGSVKPDYLEMKRI